MRRAPLLLLLLAPAATAQVSEGTAQPFEAAETRTMMRTGVVFDWPDFDEGLTFSVRASSALAPEGRRTYGAANVSDRRLATAWAEGAAGTGVGERLTFRLDRADPGVDVDGMVIGGCDVVNGYARTEATWRANGRARDLLVLLNGRPVRRLTLADVRTPQQILWAPIPFSVGDELTLEIRSVYAGAQYEDTALTEVRLNGWTE